MPPVGFELTISAGKLPQTYTLDRAAGQWDQKLNNLPQFIFDHYISCGSFKVAVTQNIAYAMYAIFAMYGKIAAFTDNVGGHIKLKTLCTQCWRCSYIAVLFDSWLYF